MIEKFDPLIYKTLSYDNLLVYALYSLQEEGKDGTFENLVVRTYEYFPQRFGLPGYFEKYPDSAQVDKSWLRCRTDKGLIRGTKAQGFIVTDKGLEVVNKLNKILKKGRFDTKKLLKTLADRRTKTGRLVSQVLKNKAYKKFKKFGKDADITEFEFCDLLYCTPDSPPETRRKNLEQLRDALSDYNQEELLEFLEWAEGKFINLLFDTGKKEINYRGGMMKKRAS